ncbi:MAG: hypothetical protein B7Z04_11360 [Rhodobacterales bacterium 32-66-9]|nr:MAG: hypothetical protein B7Z04_11360 [Rhodobacterales bacterium 32-66-9]
MAGSPARQAQLPDLAFDGNVRSSQILDIGGAPVMGRGIGMVVARQDHVEGTACHQSTVVLHVRLHDTRGTVRPLPARGPGRRDATVGRSFGLPVDDTSGEVSCATTPPRPAMALPSPLVMLIAAQGYFDPFNFLKKFTGPKPTS